MTDNLNFSVENIEENYNNITENSTTEIIGYTDFNRVNLDDLMSIYNYGSDVINETAILQNTVASMFNFDEADPKKFDKTIEKLSKFGENLDKKEENDEKSNQLVPVNSIIQKIIKVKDKVLGNVPNDSYQDLYIDYKESIGDVVSLISNDINYTLTKVNMQNEFVAKLKESVKRLEYLIKVGYEDLEKYEKEIEDLKEDYNNNQNVEMLQKIQKAPINIETFQSRLTTLKGALNSWVDTLQKIHVEQAADAILLINYREYQQTTAPNLLIDAVSMVGVRKQRKEIDNFNRLVNVTNDVLVKNSQMLLQNVESAVSLSEKGNITIETRKEMVDNVKKAVNVLNEGRNRVVQSRIAESQILDDLTESLKELNPSLNTFDSEVNVLDTFASNQYQIPSSPKQKTIGIFKSGK